MDSGGQGQGGGKEVGKWEEKGEEKRESGEEQGYTPRGQYQVGERCRKMTMLMCTSTTNSRGSDRRETDMKMKATTSSGIKERNRRGRRRFGQQMTASPSSSSLSSLQSPLSSLSSTIFQPCTANTSFTSYRHHFYHYRNQFRCRRYKRFCQQYLPSCSHPTRHRIRCTVFRIRNELNSELTDHLQVLPRMQMLHEKRNKTLPHLSPKVRRRRHHPVYCRCESTSRKDNTDSTSLNSYDLASEMTTASEAAKLMKTCSRYAIEKTEAENLLQEALAKGNVQLVKSIIMAMRRSLSESNEVDSALHKAKAHDNNPSTSTGSTWPPMTNEIQKIVIKNLSQQLKVRDAIELLGFVTSGGVPEGEEVAFGDIVSCPTDSTPLAVVQPQQNVLSSACACCRYGYKLVTGVISKMNSESLEETQRGLIGAFQSVNTLLTGQRKYDLKFTHKFIVTGSDGQDRAFEACTTSDQVPARIGDRVTVVCAIPDGPMSVELNLGSQEMIVGRLLSARAPGRISDEPMMLQNHTVDKRHELRRPPSELERLTTSFLATSLLLVPTIGVVSSLVADGNSELASSLVVAGESLGVAAVTTAVSKYVISPQLRQIDNESEIELIRANQTLLTQYQQLQQTIAKLISCGEDDINNIARLKQLENKMRSVSASESNSSASQSSSPSYDARLQRVVRAREEVDTRLDGIIDLLWNYGRVCSMIEIEVELTTNITSADSVRQFAVSIDEELDSLRTKEQEVTTQSQASEEVEKLFTSDIYS